MAAGGVADRDWTDRRTMKGLVAWQRRGRRARRGPRGEGGEGGRRGASWVREGRKEGTVEGYKPDG